VKRNASEDSFYPLPENNALEKRFRASPLSYVFSMKGRFTDLASFPCETFLSGRGKETERENNPKNRPAEICTTVSFFL
jgi:hypothetical protein